MIISFYKSTDKWGEFSNFSNHSFVLEDINWKSAEHYIQCKKFKDKEIIKEIQNSKFPNQTLLISKNNKSKQIPNWYNIKIEVNFVAIINKVFQNKEIYDILKNTNYYIINNTSLDNFWGTGKYNNGLNIHGKLLMYIRDNFVNTLNFGEYNSTEFNSSFWEKYEKSCKI